MLKENMALDTVKHLTDEFVIFRNGVVYTSNNDARSKLKYLVMRTENYNKYRDIQLVIRRHDRSSKT